MKNTAINTQPNQQTANEVDMNAMSNSMTMLLIYHGLSTKTGKTSAKNNEIVTSKPTR